MGMAKSQLDQYLKIGLLSTLVVVTVYFSANIIMPILLSGFIAMILYPLVRKVDNWGVPKVLAVAIIVLLVSSCLVIITIGIGIQTQKIVQEFPNDEVGKVLEDPIQSVEDKADVEISEYTELIDNGINSLKNGLKKGIPSVLRHAKNTVVFFVTCPIYIFFMLLYSKNIREFYLEVIKNRSRGKVSLSSLEETYKNYIKGMLIVMTIVAVLTGIGLSLLGIKYAIFIGALTGFLTILPYVGVFISALIPILLALITKDSAWYALGVLAVYGFVQFLEGNFITPKIVGDQVNINPLIVIIGLVIFGAIGGVAGMIITIPVLALIKTIAEHVPEWRPIKTLLEVR